MFPPLAVPQLAVRVPKLGLIAGGGEIPGLVIAACQAQGRPLHVLALKGHADPAVIGDFPADWLRLGEVANGFSIFKKAQVEHVLMIGPIRRPSFLELAPDLKTAAFVARIGMKSLGDDGVLRSVVAELESAGFKVVGIDEVLADCLCPIGLLGTQEPDEQARADIQRGVQVAIALGKVDVGQSVIVQQGIVLGVEAIEGTDQLIRRCAGLKRSGPGGVLVKLKKPGQERRVDLPTIGMTTLREVSAAGLRGIAVQGNGSLVLGRESLTAEADHLGVFVQGIVVDDQ